MNKLFAILFVVLFVTLLLSINKNTNVAQADENQIFLITYVPSPVALAPVEQKLVAPEPTYEIVNMEVTAYCPCKKCCGKNAKGIAADGTKVKGKMLLAADWDVMPKGSILSVPGYGTATVHDTGSAIVGNKLDVYFDSHKVAKEWGRQYLDVKVLRKG